MDFASIGSSSYIGQMSSVSSIASASSISSSSSSSYSSSVQSSSSYDQLEISSAGRQSQQPPDFDSMSTEEFRSHLEEIQSKMATDGVTSDLPDVSTLTDAELDELKTEMASKGPQGPPPGGKRPEGPPPPPPGGGVDMSALEEESDELLDSLLEALEESDEDASSITSVDELVNSAAFQQLVSEYSISNS